jgi:hypothetical protein
MKNTQLVLDVIALVSTRPIAICLVEVAGAISPLLLAALLS